MKILNKAARLINFNFGGTKYKLMPAGNSVEVPDEAMGSKFLKALIELGDVSITEAAGSATDEKDEAEALEALKAEAEALEVSVDKRWGIKRLKEEIEKAKEA